MPLVRLQVWNLGCDYADRDGRWCWTSLTRQGVTRAEAIAAAIAAGWSVTRRPGRTELRCPEHRRLHSRPPQAYRSGRGRSRVRDRRRRRLGRAALDGPRFQDPHAEIDRGTEGPQVRSPSVLGTSRRVTRPPTSIASRRLRLKLALPRRPERRSQADGHRRAESGATAVLGRLGAANELVARGPGRR